MAPKKMTAAAYFVWRKTAAAQNRAALRHGGHQQVRRTEGLHFHLFRFSSRSSGREMEIRGGTRNGRIANKK